MIKKELGRAGCGGVLEAREVAVETFNISGGISACRG